MLSFWSFFPFVATCVACWVELSLSQVLRYISKFVTKQFDKHAHSDIHSEQASVTVLFDSQQRKFKLENGDSLLQSLYNKTKPWSSI